MKIATPSCCDLCPRTGDAWVQMRQPRILVKRPPTIWGQPIMVVRMVWLCAACAAQEAPA